MARTYTYIQQRGNKKGIDSPLTTEYETLLTQNKTLIGALNELYRLINGNPNAVCGEPLSGEVLCGVDIDNLTSEYESETFLKEEFIDKFGG